MEFLSTFLILLISSAVLAWIWLKHIYSYWQKRGVSTLPYSLLWGNARNAVFQEKSFNDGVKEYYNDFKAQGSKHGGVYILWNPIYLAMDINVVKSIMQADFHHFVDRGLYYDEKNDPLSAHLFSLGGKKWKLLRTKLTPTFTSGKMKMMYETLVDCTKGLYKVIDKNLGKPVDVKDVLGRFTTDIIGSCAFGLDCNSLENPDSEFRDKGVQLFSKQFPDNIRLLAVFAVPQIARLFKLKLLSREVNDFFLGIVRDNVAYREDNNIYRKDFMHLLIQLKNRGQLVDDEKLTVEQINEQDNKITLDEIAAQAFIFFEAGFETSATTMTFCLYELAKNKDMQERARVEIMKVMAKHGGQLTYEALMDVDYLDRAVNETLRKYPPLAGLFRICNKDYKVPDTDIILEKGVRVMIPVSGIHHDPDFYPNPEIFDPERFTEENKKTRPVFSFLPFGEGPRNCIGARFGVMQAKLGLAAILMNYEFSVNSKTEEPLQYDHQSFIISTKGGMWLDFKKLSVDTVPLLRKK